MGRLEQALVGLQSGGTVDAISSCEACPYSYPQWVSNRIVCAHDAAPGGAGEFILGKAIDKLPERPPPECPLRKSPTLVVLVEDKGDPRWA